MWRRAAQAMIPVKWIRSFLQLATRYKLNAALLAEEVAFFRSSRGLISVLRAVLCVTTASNPVQPDPAPLRWCAGMRPPANGHESPRTYP